MVLVTFRAKVQVEHGKIHVVPRTLIAVSSLSRLYSPPQRHSTYSTLSSAKVVKEKEQGTLCVCGGGAVCVPSTHRDTQTIIQTDTNRQAHTHTHTLSLCLSLTLSQSQTIIFVHVCQRHFVVEREVLFCFFLCQNQVNHMKQVCEE